jgi:hypothetical protein
MVEGTDGVVSLGKPVLNFAAVNWGARFTNVK